MVTLGKVRMIKEPKDDIKSIEKAASIGLPLLMNKNIYIKTIFIIFRGEKTLMF